MRARAPDHEQERPTRASAANVLLAVVSLASCLAVVECALRLWESIQASNGAARLTASTGLPELRGVMQLAAPNTVGVYKGQIHRTNDYGFRGPEPPLEKPPGEFRIAVIGDSVTMGEGVPEDRTYTSLLQSTLGSNFQVINLGLSGLNLRQSLDHRLPIGLKFDPDLIVYGFTINDLEGLPSYRMTRRNWNPTRWRLLRLARLGWIRLGEFFASRGSYRSEIEDNYFANAAVWSEFETDLSKLVDVARQRSVCVCLFVHPHLGNLDEPNPLERHYERVEKAAAIRGLQVIRALQVFRGLRPDAVTIAPQDPHPNEEGHRLLARALADGLRALPDACWQGHEPPAPDLAALGEPGAN